MPGMINRAPLFVRVTVLVPFVALLAACGQAGGDAAGAAGALLETGVAVAKDAAGAAAELADTRTVCVIAGQSPAFCGCLQNELGPRVDSVAVDALSTMVKSTLDGGLTGAAEALKDVDPATREALTRCAVQGAASEVLAQ
jgi:hypothetical protein